VTAGPAERQLHGVAIYNPDLLSKRELVAQFVARQELLDQIVADLHRPGFNQHQIVVGTRGMGKTTLLRRIRYAIEDDPALAAVWQPLTFPEEQYNVGRLSDLYLNFIDALGDALEQSGRREEASTLDDAVEALPRGDEGRRSAAALDLLLGMARQLDRRLVLLIDNLDLVLDRLEKQQGAQWAFRELLSHENRLLLIGAMPVIIGATYDYEAPFYDFFRIHELRGLTREETRTVLTRLARDQNAPAVERLVERDPGRIDTLHTLTGGNPRTIALLFSVLAQGTEGDVRSDLEKLLDQCTPLYKARFEALPPQAQQVVDAVAIHWDPISAGELTDKLPMDVNAISAQLNRLVQQGVLEKVEYHPATKTGFQVAERFFNIWYLMRASRRVRRRLIWLVQFLRLFFGADQVKSKAHDLLQSALRDSSDEKLRHAEFCLAVAQLIDDDRSMRFALESRAIRTLLTDQGLTDQIPAMLDLDGEDMSLRDVIDRERWLEEFHRAIEGIESDAEEKSRARRVIGGAPTTRASRLKAVRHLAGQTPQERESTYKRYEERRQQLVGLWGPSFTAKVTQALIDGLLDGIKDRRAAPLAASVLGTPELEILAWTDVSDKEARLRGLLDTTDASVLKPLLAECLKNRGATDEASAVLATINEPSAYADLVTGVVATIAGRIDDGAKFFEQATARSRAVKVPWSAISDELLALGRVDAALKMLERILSKARTADVLAAYGSILARVERVNEAEIVLREAMQHAPDHVSAAGTLAWILVRRGEFDEVLTMAARFAEAADKQLRLAKAVALLGARRNEEAVQVVQRWALEEPDPRLALAHTRLLFMASAADDALATLRLLLASGGDSVVAITLEVVDTFEIAVKCGAAAPVLRLVEELELQDVLRPAVEALRIIVTGEPDTLRRLAPEVQEATAELLERWLPSEAKKSRKKPAPKRRRKRLT
jgi:tetratricopeptide (TPR) repeat protein